jgi:hypothetical protein
LRPAQNIFLEEPRKQNLFRNNFVKTVSTPPAPEPLTLLADDLYKVRRILDLTNQIKELMDQIKDKSCPSLTKDELCNFFKRR